MTITPSEIDQLVNLPEKDYRRNVIKLLLEKTRKEYRLILMMDLVKTILLVACVIELTSILWKHL